MAREKRGCFKDGVYQEYGIYVKIPGRIYSTINRTP
jgi:hypothetical protein